MNNYTEVMILAGVVIGIVAAGVILKKTGLIFTERKPLAEKDMMSKLIENQLVCDALDTGNITAWFREKEVLTKGNAVFFLAKPTAYTAKMFFLQEDWKQLDPKHNLLQAVVDEEKKLPVAVRVISFNTMPRDLADKIKDKDYIILM